MKNRIVIAAAISLFAVGAATLAAPAAGKLKVGFIYLGPVGDFGWTYQHEVARQGLVKALGDKIDTTYLENVNEGPDSERSIEQLARTGHQLIFTTSFGYMDPTIKVASRYPKVDFVLKETSTSKIAEGLLAGTLDAGFLREFDPPKALHVEWVWNEPLVAVIPSGHRLAKAQKVALAALANEPFVLFPRSVGVAFYDRLIGYCVRAGFSPRIVQEATQWQSIVTCVETGMGVSIAPACVERFRWPGVEYRALGLKTAVVACRSAAAGEPAVKFLKMTREALRA